MKDMVTPNFQAYEEQLRIIKQKFGPAIQTIESDRVHCPIVWVEKTQLIPLLQCLKEIFEYQFLSDLTAYDDLGTPEASQGRFVVVYNLFSLSSKLRFRVKVRLQEGQTLLTAVQLWEGANWAEREVYDLFGIKFDNHPDLRRILLDIRWEGHPLRKDYHWRKSQIFLDPEEIPYHLLEPEQDTKTTGPKTTNPAPHLKPEALPNEKTC